MKIRLCVLTVAALLAAAGAANAQANTDKRPITEERAKQIQERKDAIAKQRADMVQARREDVQKQRDQMKQQRDQAIGQRREIIEQLREMQKQLRDEVKAGKLTQEQAREQLRTWRKDHKPARPDGPKPAVNGSV